MRTTLLLSVTFLAASALLACGGSAGDSGDAGSDDSGGGPDGTIDAHPDDSGEGRDSSADAGTADADGGSDGAIDLDGDASDLDGEPCDGWSWDGGPPCYANSDCVRGQCEYAQTVCTTDGTHTTYTTSQACPGFCVPYAEGDGGFCGTLPVCDPDSGLTCDPFSHACVSPASAVLPVVDAGARCGLGVANCSSGSYCEAPTFPDDGVCDPIIADGGACDPGNIFEGCAAGLVCVGYGTSPGAGVCRPPSPTGGPCVTGTGEGSSGCDPSALCADGGCVPLPSTGPCLDGQCDRDAGYCASTGTCMPWQPNGAACTSASQCASGLCASTSGTCVAELPLGAACGSFPYDCSQGLCAGDAPGCASGICDLTGHCAAVMCARAGDAGSH